MGTAIRIGECWRYSGEFWAQTGQSTLYGWKVERRLAEVCVMLTPLPSEKVRSNGFKLFNLKAGSRFSFSLSDVCHILISQNVLIE